MADPRDPPTRTRIRLDQSRQVSELLESVRRASELRQAATDTVNGTRRPKISIVIDGLGQWQVDDDVLRHTLALWGQEKVEARYAAVVAALGERGIDLEEEPAP